ncbi:MAG: hypothetical protein V3S55_14890 [Nitrospiraceae bacterium]
MASSVSYVAATAVLTLTDQFDNTETCVVGGKTYTFQTSLTDTDGNIAIGANVAGDLLNLLAAINLSNEGESAVGAGNDYAASMTINAEVSARLAEITATTLTVRAKTAGTVGNLIACTETHGEGSWDNATLTGGLLTLDAYLADLFLLNQINSEVKAELLSITSPAD